MPKLKSSALSEESPQVNHRLGSDKKEARAEI